MPGPPAAAKRGAGERAASMVRTTPFHERTSALNETGLWEHWANCLAAQRYQMSEKFEYFAIRNAAGLFDTSPLYKYRFTRAGRASATSQACWRATRGSAPSGKAQYTLWCDDRGYVIEDGVLLHVGGRRSTCSPPPSRISPTSRASPAASTCAIEDVTEAWGILSIQGPRSREILAVRRAGGRRPRLLRRHRDEDRRRAGARSRGPATRATSASRSGSPPADALARLGRGLGGRQGPGADPVRDDRAVHGAASRRA